MDFMLQWRKRCIGPRFVAEPQTMWNRTTSQIPQGSFTEPCRAGQPDCEQEFIEESDGRRHALDYRVSTKANADTQRFATAIDDGDFSTDDDDVERGQVQVFEPTRTKHLATTHYLNQILWMGTCPDDHLPNFELIAENTFDSARKATIHFATQAKEAERRIRSAGESGCSAVDEVTRNTCEGKDKYNRKGSTMSGGPRHSVEEGTQCAARTSPSHKEGTLRDVRLVKEGNSQCSKFGGTPSLRKDSRLVDGQAPTVQKLLLQSSSSPKQARATVGGISREKDSDFRLGSEFREVVARHSPELLGDGDGALELSRCNVGESSLQVTFGCTATLQSEEEGKSFRSEVSGDFKPSRSGDDGFSVGNDGMPRCGSGSNLSTFIDSEMGGRHQHQGWKHHSSGGHTMPDDRRRESCRPNREFPSSHPVGVKDGRKNFTAGRTEKIGRRNKFVSAPQRDDCCSPIGDARGQNVKELEERRSSGGVVCGNIVNGHQFDNASQNFEKDRGLFGKRPVQPRSCKEDGEHFQQGDPRKLVRKKESLPQYLKTHKFKSKRKIKTSGLPLHIKKDCVRKIDLLHANALIEADPLDAETMKSWRLCFALLTDAPLRDTLGAPLEFPKGLSESDIQEMENARVIERIAAGAPAGGGLRIFCVDELHKLRRRIIRHTFERNEVEQGLTKLVNFPTQRKLFERVTSSAAASCIDFAGFYDAIELPMASRRAYGFQANGKIFTLTTLPTGERISVAVAHILCMWVGKPAHQKRRGLSGAQSCYARNLWQVSNADEGVPAFQ